MQSLEAAERSAEETLIDEAIPAGKPRNWRAVSLRFIRWIWVLAFLASLVYLGLHLIRTPGKMLNTHLNLKVGFSGSGLKFGWNRMAMGYELRSDVDNTAGALLLKVPPPYLGRHLEFLCDVRLLRYSPDQLVEQSLGTAHFGDALVKSPVEMSQITDTDGQLVYTVHYLDSGFLLVLRGSESDPRTPGKGRRLADSVSDLGPGYWLQALLPLLFTCAFAVFWRWQQLGRRTWLLD